MHNDGSSPHILIQFYVEQSQLTTQSTGIIDQTTGKDKEKHQCKPLDLLCVFEFMQKRK